MGYGGTAYATVSVDIVQTDVDAIIQGLTGYGGMTLTDVHGPLTYMADLMSGNYYGPLMSMADSAWQCREFLSGYNYGPLTDIRDYLWIDGYSAAWWLRENQYRASDILMYLSGGWNGPITDTAWNTATVRDFLSGSNYGPLTDMRDTLYYIDTKLYSGYWGSSAADLLGDIRDHISAIRFQTDQLTFDGNGNLRVVTY